MPLGVLIGTCIDGRKYLYANSYRGLPIDTKPRKVYSLHKAYTKTVLVANTGTVFSCALSKVIIFEVSGKYHAFQLPDPLLRDARTRDSVRDHESRTIDVGGPAMRIRHGF